MSEAVTPSPGNLSMSARQGGLRALPGFVGTGDPADVAVLIVTFNSECEVPGLIDSLRQEARDQSIRVVVADNSQTPLTMQALSNHQDVVAFSTGANLGYAGAINAARKRAGVAGNYLILNPDLRVKPGAVAALRKRMESTGAGVVVPQLLDEDGSTYRSLRREPTLFRALGDALMGSRLRKRPGWLSEMDHDAGSYRRPHRVDWATGAALLIRSDVAEAVGDWDERFFLYSEETDYMRRVRSMGFAVWYEPLAVMVHSRGGSGSSPGLEALMGANRIRYVQKFHRTGYARAFRAAVVFSALLRVPLPGRWRIFALVANPSRWGELPRATAHPSLNVQPTDVPYGAVIIPAHNEAAVLGRTLDALKVPLDSGRVEVIVACNGCTDGTAEVARSVSGVRVIQLLEASKVAALNAGDCAATRWPRLYLDADIELPAEALCATLDALSADDGVLCARPAFCYQTEGASWLVRAYYRARNRLPQASASMWGAGIYGLSHKGHQRLERFPMVTADDCFIDRLFGADEKSIVACRPVIVRTPRSAKALLSTLKRIYRGNSELTEGRAAGSGHTARQLAASVRGPASASDALVYGVFALAGRLASGPRREWERDESSRTAREES